MMRAETKVGLLIAALVASTVPAIFLLGDHPSPLDTSFHWWQFAIAFFVVESVVAHIEIRKETVTLTLGEAVMLVCLAMVSPLGVIAARTVGGTAALLRRRQPAQKFCFNVALFAWESAIAAVIAHLVFGAHSDNWTLWAAGGASVLIAALLSVGTVAIVISFFNNDRPIGLLKSALAVQAVIAVASISIATVGVAAVADSRVNIAYLLFLLMGIVLLLRRDAATAQRSSDLEAIGDFTSRLIGLTSTKDVAETSLRDIAKTLRANRAALLMPATCSIPLRTYRLETDDFAPSVVFDLADFDEAMGARLLERRSVDGARIIPEGVVAPITIGKHRGVVLVWDRSTSFGQFRPRDPHTLSSMVEQVHVALERATLVDQLHYDAHHDALTQLPNRLGFSQQFASPQRVSGALFVIDLDRFKDINDTLGHPTGDRVLQIMAERLRRAIGEETSLARLGGDEFAVFHREAVDPTVASAFAEKLVTVIEHPVKLEDLSLQVGASIGIAMAPSHGDDLTALMSHADTAMYEAKAAQSGWQFYRHETDTNDPRRLELVSELRKAIERRELDVWYQPRIDLSDRSVVGAEALARWNHERYGFVPPDEFIALAEGAGLMRDLTNAILERTVSDMKRWDDYGIELQIAVNLSTRNLLDDSLPGRVDKLLKRNKISANRLAFEITETAIMIDRERVTELLGEFHALGISLAIDDYGTGYSSLAYLRDLPVDELKIDRSFITNVDMDPRNEVIVRSTIDMAHNLGLIVVAEGIERDEEYCLLSRLGCDFAQGYLMSKPLAAEKFEVWLEDNGHPPTPPVIADITELRAASGMCRPAVRPSWS